MLSRAFFESLVIPESCVLRGTCITSNGPDAIGGGALVWRFEAAGRTDVGRIREENQDAFQLNPEKGLYVLADGMGGQRGGAVASRMAVEGLVDFAQFLPSMKAAERLDVLNGAFQMCSSQILSRGIGDPELSGMGTTLLALHLDEASGRYCIAHAGDSRAYRIRKHRIEQLTEDHSFHNECRNMGIPEDQWRRFSKSIITRAVGLYDRVHTDLLTDELQDGDAFLLCSDGLTEPLLDAALLQIVDDHEDPQAACDALVKLANEGGGPDNITAVLVRALR
jgi:serine/threonine protein phosphatase PrpC